MKSLGAATAKALVLTIMFGPAISGFGQASATQQAPSSPDATANEHAGGPTAQNQGESPSDRQLTQQIRRAVMQDRTLSTSAHNVKIITQNGVVTLKGQVPSEDDKAAVETKAAELAGRDKVVNEITVASQQK
jgi:osmotically-inducible protein OsmY